MNKKVYVKKEVLHVKYAWQDDDGFVVADYSDGKVVRKQRSVAPPNLDNYIIATGVPNAIKEEIES